jgi:PAS domain S-box-containing protein
MNEISCKFPREAHEAETDIADDLPLPYVEVDAEGVVRRANRAALPLYPLEFGEVVGREMWEMLPPDQQRMSFAAFNELMKSGAEPGPVMRSLYTRAGEYRTFRLHRNLIRRADGRPTGMRLIAVDVTEETRALDEAHQMRAWMESMMESAPDGLVVTDALGFVRHFNPTAEEILGWRAKEAIGKVIEKVMPILHCATGDSAYPSFSMRLEGVCRGLATVLDRDRNEIAVEVTSSPIREKETGYTTGVLTVLRKA